MDAAGAVVVADALHCTKKSANAVVEADADYLFSVKDNNPGLKADIALNLAKEFKSASNSRKAISGILKQYLFDLNNFSAFLRVLERKLD